MPVIARLFTIQADSAVAYWQISNLVRLPGQDPAQTLPQRQPVHYRQNGVATDVFWATAPSLSKIAALAAPKDRMQPAS